MSRGLVLKQVSFSRNGQSVLKGINLQLKRGEIVGLIGPNGAGKTTLLKLLIKLLKPSEGTILLDGKRLNDWPQNQLAQHISYLPQNPVLESSFSCREVVLMGRYAALTRFQQISNEDIAVADQVMLETGTGAFASRPITELSGGERQRVLLARSMAQGAGFLLLDEPTANLDPHYQLDLFDLAASLTHKNVGVVVAIHDLNLAADHCNRLILLHEGEVVKEGRPESVLLPNLLRSVYRIDAEIVRHPKTARLSVFPRQIKNAQPFTRGKLNPS